MKYPGAEQKGAIRLDRPGGKVGGVGQNWPLTPKETVMPPLLMARIRDSVNV